MRSRHRRLIFDINVIRWYIDCFLRKSARRPGSRHSILTSDLSGESIIFNALPITFWSSRANTATTHLQFLLLNKMNWRDASLRTNLCSNIKGFGGETISDYAIAWTSFQRRWNSVVSIDRFSTNFMDSLFILWELYQWQPHYSRESVVLGLHQVCSAVTLDTAIYTVTAVSGTSTPSILLTASWTFRNQPNYLCLILIYLYLCPPSLSWAYPGPCATGEHHWKVMTIWPAHGSNLSRWGALWTILAIPYSVQ